MSLDKSKNNNINPENSSFDFYSQYLCVISPSSWLILLSVLIIIIGSCFWCVMASVNEKAGVAVYGDGITSYALIPQRYEANISEDSTIIIDKEVYQLSNENFPVIEINNQTNSQIKTYSQVSTGDTVIPKKIDNYQNCGICQGFIVIGKKSPIDILLNNS